MKEKFAAEFAELQALSKKLCSCYECIGVNNDRCEELLCVHHSKSLFSVAELPPYRLVFSKFSEYRVIPLVEEKVEEKKSVRGRRRRASGSSSYASVAQQQQRIQQGTLRLQQAEQQQKEMQNFAQVRLYLTSFFQQVQAYHQASYSMNMVGPCGIIIPSAFGSVDPHANSNRGPNPSVINAVPSLSNPPISLRQQIINSGNQWNNV
jgi:hypothetical protein